MGGVVPPECRPRVCDKYGCMERSEQAASGRPHWMALEGGSESAAGGGLFLSRFAAIGASVPERRLSTAELMASTRHRTRIDLERLTGVRERHVVGDGEDSY